ncbi:DNA-directed RNA polymerases I and III subunit RPAC2 [Perkinsus olseni]|uniref:DNA-directed RNA polymerases I and III subunit RPAC2 n=1 Tax=Perkinsus olseni TaxID=32597 RepID=A0A7J6RK87_PEROL|nr:DNA-directed RNA polymerases I and III subunit RPAC2 [Perkinsus olseni]KAF4721078.1 DNA-directed RNA polymerases I and III subunit RPAC2 [Perkinsus olseni]
MSSKESTEDLCGTYQLKNEDHTLGNSVRYVLSKNPKVDFAGYSVPHPNEPFVNIRVQTYPGTTADDAMIWALEELDVMFNTIQKKYTSAMNRYRRKHAEEE